MTPTPEEAAGEYARTMIPVGDPAKPKGELLGAIEGSLLVLAYQAFLAGVQWRDQNPPEKLPEITTTECSCGASWITSPGASFSCPKCGAQNNVPRLKIVSSSEPKV